VCKLLHFVAAAWCCYVDNMLGALSHYYRSYLDARAGLDRAKLVDEEGARSWRILVTDDRYEMKMITDDGEWKIID